jgi:hypothetical protein
MDGHYYCSECDLMVKEKEIVVEIKDITYDCVSEQLCSLTQVYCPECNQMLLTQIDSIAASLL